MQDLKARTTARRVGYAFFYVALGCTAYVGWLLLKALLARLGVCS